MKIQSGGTTITDDDFLDCLNKHPHGLRARMVIDSNLTAVTVGMDVFRRNSIEDITIYSDYDERVNILRKALREVNTSLRTYYENTLIHITDQIKRKTKVDSLINNSLRKVNRTVGTACAWIWNEVHRLLKENAEDEWVLRDTVRNIGETTDPVLRARLLERLIFTENGLQRVFKAPICPMDIYQFTYIMKGFAHKPDDTEGVDLLIAGESKLTGLTKNSYFDNDGTMKKSRRKAEIDPLLDRQALQAL